MDIFEEQETKRIEEKEYQELAKKSKKLLRTSLSITFSVIGLIFLVIGIMDFIFDFETEYVIGIVYSIVGVLFIITGILCFVFINPEKVISYEEYKKRLKKYNYSYVTSLEFRILEKKVELLEEELEKLRKNNN